ncbi:hypothetical protein [Streptomyces sp. NBC_01727]|uniref:hypothetical protein n=1 Tax=Streptomyces sp. NBC_01727 TaxID=2975924 RepID=UPI002E0E056F|nr:hypothetical protein OIE76_39790 [Streptomyces sp. NBC_01727]
MLLQQCSFPDSVEDEGGACDVADPAGAERDVLEGAPSLLKFGGGTFSEGSHVSQQRVEHAGVDVKCLTVLALGVPLMARLLAISGIPARTVVPLCGSVGRRLGWAAVVFALGTLGVLAGLAAYGGDVDLGSAGTRVALTGVPYAVAVAFFVPSRGYGSGRWLCWRQPEDSPAEPIRGGLSRVCSAPVLRRHRRR